MAARCFPSDPRTEYARGVLYATGAGIALGTLGPISNLAYGVGMSSPSFAALRATIGAIALGVVLLSGHGEWTSLRSLSTRECGLLALTATAQAVLSLCVFAAYGSMAVGLVLAVYFCYPLLVALASIALGVSGRRRPDRGLAIAMVGLATVVLAGTTSGLGAVTVVGFALGGHGGDVPGGLSRGVAVRIYPGRVPTGDGHHPDRRSGADERSRHPGRVPVGTHRSLAVVRPWRGCRSWSPGSLGRPSPRSGCSAASGASAGPGRRPDARRAVDRGPARRGPARTSAESHPDSRRRGGPRRCGPRSAASLRSIGLRRSRCPWA